MTTSTSDYLDLRRLAQTRYRQGDRTTHVGVLKARLNRYGYLPAEGCDCDPFGFCVHMRRAVRLYQQFHGLDATGAIDGRTLKQLSAKRCGVPDVETAVALENLLSDAGVDEQDPFVFRINTTPWPRYDLTYRVYNGTADIGGSVEDDRIRSAFDVWAAVCPLHFTRVTSNEDIRLGWEVGDHGDNSPFDGVGDVVAHGYYPTNGNVHFDDAETWRANTENVDLLHVAIHEIGHALGLGHSRTKDSIMWPNVQNGRHDLAEEDIRGILSLYPFLVGTRDPAAVAHLWAFAGGTSSAAIDLGARKRFLAWGQVTFVDPLIDYDRDNGVALDIFTVDGNNTARVGWGGDHLGTEGAPSNLFAGAVIGSGQVVQFRLSTFHSADLEAYGVGCVVVLD